MAEIRKFERLEEIPDASEPHPAQPRVDQLATDGLMLALKALSQRAALAIPAIFTLLSVGSAFWLWNSIPDPKPFQIVSLSIYALFVLAANWLVRRK